jgi:hypothetical protein
MPHLIIGLTLVRIAEHFVGLGQFFELGLCFRITFVAIRMILQRQFAIRLLEVVVAGALCDTQSSIVVLSHIA